MEQNLSHVGPRSNLPVITDAGFASYLKQINRFPLLSAQEELGLAEKYRKHGDLDAAHRLVTANLRFVIKVALEYRFYGIKLVDLVQEGNMGLLMALKRFDPDKGYRFMSYAVWWVRAYIRSFVMRNWSLVKIGTTQAQKKLFYKIGKVRKTLESEGEVDEKYEALAKDLHVSKRDIIEMEQRMSAKDFSLEAPTDGTEELTHLDLLQQEGPNQEEWLAEEEEKKVREHQIHNAMKRLKAMEVYVIQHRIMAEDAWTLQEVGDHLNLSRERVRQIENEALKKLKGALSGEIRPS
jgi:RNA polymerase sigma-32 factor